MSGNAGIGSLLREAYDLKEKQNAIKRRLAEIADLVAESAVFKPGGKTARVAADGVMAKVTLKETTSWDQNGLRMAFDAIGPKEFRKAFVWEFKPISASTLKTWMADPATSDEARRLVDEARTVKAGSPSVSYELVEE